MNSFSFRHFSITSTFLLLSFFSFSQVLFPLENQKNDLIERILDSSAKFHSSIKPFLVSSATSQKLDSLHDHTSGISLGSENSKNKMFLNGILNTTGGMENISSISNRKYSLEAGIHAEAFRNKKIGGSFTFFSGLSSFPFQVNNYADTAKIIPGIGPSHSFSDGYSYQYYAGYLSYSPNKIFNFQAGRGKNFFGDGYRSLFLSDVASPYPFLKITSTVWKLKYVSLFTWMKDVTNLYGLKKDLPTGQAGFLNKYATFHYLSWNVSKRLNFALFESIVWQGTDSNRVRNYDVNYLNPVIFFRPVEYSLGSSDNACLGGSFKVKVGKKYKQQFYGQLVLDEFLLKEVLAIFKKITHPFDPTIKYGWWANKQGVQLGFKSVDLFTLKNLTFRTEINAVRPYTYSHGSVQQNYAHFNQALAHPLGANFAESVSFLNYRYKKWIFDTEFLYAIYGKDENGKNYGQNIFLSYTTHPNDYGNKFFQGLKTNLLYTSFKISYFLFPSADLMAEAGVALRQEKNSIYDIRSNFIFIGIKTGILNRYSDF